MLETLREDLGYGLRALAQTPATLALGIVFLQYHLFDDLTVGEKVMALFRRLNARGRSSSR